jgi:phospholipid-binding lipoprotein MlaA
MQQNIRHCYFKFVLQSLTKQGGGTVKLTAYVLIMFSFIFLVYNRASAGPSSPESQTLISVPRQETTPPIEQAKPAVVAEPQQKPAELQKAAVEPDIIEEEKEEAAIQIADPIRPWNYAMYHFNDRLYFWVLKPASKGYSAVIPEDIRIAVSNFFDNVTTPVRFVSSILQLKIGKAGNELLRFVYNSTAGVCGLADAAKADFGIKRQEEDLGQALGSYGIGHGFYIVWPFFGPSSLRDTVGLIGDTFLDPVSYVDPLEASVGITAYDKVNTVSLHIGDYEDLKKSAIDPYVSIRDAYLQYRKKKVEE